MSATDGGIGGSVVYFESFLFEEEAAGKDDGAEETLSFVRGLRLEDRVR